MMKWCVFQVNQHHDRPVLKELHFNGGASYLALSLEIIHREIQVKHKKQALSRLFLLKQDGVLASCDRESS